jgi:hypothetical protein
MEIYDLSEDNLFKNWTYSLNKSYVETSTARIVLSIVHVNLYVENVEINWSV